MKLAAAAAAALLSSTAEAQQLDMTTFFAGRTHAENVLKISLQRPKKMVVDSVGRLQGNQFILIDTIHEEGKPVRTREWRMRAAGPGRYTGTLSDAVGPVDVAVKGNGAEIRYTMKGGLKISQQMQLLSDGRTLSSHVIVRKFGLKFATVEGKVRKLD